MSKFSKLQKQIYKELDLAEIYLDDGAPRTAAKKLRKAADLLDLLAAERDKLFSTESKLAAAQAGERA